MDEMNMNAEVIEEVIPEAVEVIENATPKSSNFKYGVIAAAVLAVAGTVAVVAVKSSEKRAIKRLEKKGYLVEKKDEAVITEDWIDTTETEEEED